MRPLKLALLAAAFSLLSLSARADNCPDGTVTFNFDHVPIKRAFMIFADVAGLKPSIDPAITAAGPVHFQCMQWQVAAGNLAEKYNLRINVEKGTLYVTKK
jgi:type II secretory pathway component GspD/PulD (secretin)